MQSCKDFFINYNKMLGQIKDFYSKTISGSSLSKMVACGGYRLGYLEFHCNDLNNLYDMCNIIASSVYSCPSLIFQHVAVKVLEYPKEIVLVQTVILKPNLQNAVELTIGSILGMNILLKQVGLRRITN